MKVTYDKYYQTKNLFGDPYPELIEFFTENQNKGKILDLGCGQGRDAIPLARLGFDVTGIDYSKVGIEQMISISKTENLTLNGIVKNIFEFSDFNDFDFVLLDSMFHFEKKDIRKEIELIRTIISKVKSSCLIIFCIQDIGKKVKILNESIDFEKPIYRLIDKKFEYVFENSKSGHKSKTDYRMIVVRK